MKLIHSLKTINCQKVMRIRSFFLFVHFLHVSSNTVAVPRSTAKITQILVFGSDSETVIDFDPKSGWILNEEKKLRLYLSGTDFQNNSIVFSASSDRCATKDFLSPIYPLSSASIVKLKIHLKSISKGRSKISLCLLSSSNATLLPGPFFTFLREKSSIPYAVKICLILLLFVFSGFFSGLNLGLMSLSVNDLRLIAESEDSSLRSCAKRVLPLRKRGNFLLCSIVIANVLVNAMGTVLLDSLVHGIFAVIGSTAMIVLMGEIIPQAICSRYGLIIGAHTHVITWICMFVTGIISYPLGFILDKILGQEVTSSYTRDQIAGLLTRVGADIDKTELDVITGVLSLHKKTVNDAMTLLPDVFMLEENRTTDAELLLEVHKHGFSRIPVYANEKSNIIGIVKLRDFALITPEQYHLTVKHVLEFHNHSFGYTKINDSLYDLMQEFLKARWHIAVVQQPKNDNEGKFTVVGVITFEDVIEELLQREIIEEADYFTDNRQKIPRKRAKNTDYTALVKRSVKGPSINPQLKIAVFQFLQTNVSQFTSGFISEDILKTLLNQNIYATIKRPTNQQSNPIYLYKKGFQYEIFTLITEGHATLESGQETILSTVGPFSHFASSVLLTKNKNVKDVHQFLDSFLAKTGASNENVDALNEISSAFMPDFNLIVHSELHVLQIHRLVWLAAVRATQRQRSSDRHQRRLQPEQLFTNALDEIANVTRVTIDRINLTNFQRVFVQDGDGKNPKSSSNLPVSTVFDVVQSMDKTEPNSADVKEQNVFNPLLMSIDRENFSTGNESKSTGSINVTDNDLTNSNMHIDRMFNETDQQTNDDNQEKEQFLTQGRSNSEKRSSSVSTSPNVFPAPSSTTQPRRARSMLNSTRCVPS